jgi:hypothetical protein
VTAPQAEQAGRSPGPAEYYGAATQSLRTTARWLLTAAAGVGGVLVAGVQLTDLGGLDGKEWPRLLVASIALLAALTAIGFMIWKTSAVLTDEWITLAQLQVERFRQTARQKPGNRRERDLWATMGEILDRLMVYQDELYADVATDISDLSSRLGDANAQARRDPSKITEAAPLRSAANAVVQFANYTRTRRQLEKARRSMAWAAVVVVFGVGVYAYAANPPQPQPAGTHRTSSPSTSPSPSPSGTRGSAAPSGTTGVPSPQPSLNTP